jgi:hypothetical protein
LTRCITKAFRVRLIHVRSIIGWEPLMSAWIANGWR